MYLSYMLIHPAICPSYTMRKNNTRRTDKDIPEKLLI